MDPFIELRRRIRAEYPSNAAAADDLDITPAALSRYLARKRKPRDDIRMRIWERFGIDLNALPATRPPPTEARAGE